MGFDQKTSFKLLGANKKNVYILEKERRRIKLLDKSAVETFSELYFDAGDKNNGFDGKIIKANGQIIKLELEKSVLVEEAENVPEIFRSYTGNGGHRYYKVPVNNLEEGDILDYAYQVNNDAGTYGSFIEFTPVYYACNRSYSVMKQSFEIKLDKNTFLNSRAVNGAPEFRENPSGEYNVYTWEDANRERIKSQYFLNSYMQFPMVKFQIVYSNTENAKNLFIGNRGELKSKLSPEELSKKAASMLAGAEAYAGSQMPSLNMHLKKMEVMDVKTENYIVACYYLLRHQYALENGNMSGSLFAALMKQLLEKRGIGSQVGVTSSNRLTSMDDIIFRSEVQWFILLNDKFIFAPSAISHINEIPGWAQGSKGYLLPKSKGASPEEVTLPRTPFSENYSSYSYDVNMDPAKTDLLMVKAKHQLANNNRIAESGKLLNYELYEPDDWKTYGGWDEMESLPASQQEMINEKITKYRTEARKLKPQFMEDQLKEDFADVVKYDRFRLVQDGRHMKKQNLMYEEDYTLGEMVQYAGKSILVKLPGFLTNQLRLSGDDRTRQYDAHIGNQRSFQYQVKFTVPAGYKVFGLADLNQKVDNETGMFESKAVFENGVVTITASKVYKMELVEKASWPRMLEWIDAAYNFSQKRILLRQ
jgi:hypothetical protein